MHIAFLTPEYPEIPETNSGGLGTSIQNLANALKGCDDIEVSIIVYDQKENDSFQKSNLNFHLIAKRDYLFGGWYCYRKHLQKIINNLAEKQKIDLIEAADWTGITAFMKLDIPLVIRLHGSDAYFCKLEGRKQKWKNRWFEKNALKNADYILSVSDFTGIKTMKVFGLERSYQVIPNGIDCENFKASEEIPKANQLFYFGSLIRKKGFLELAEIFNQVNLQNPKAKLVIAGKDVVDIQIGESTWKIFQSKLSSEAIKKVKYVGQVDYKSITGFLNESAVVVLPSFAEAFPMTWLEAMAMEKAMVTSDIGWANEVMENEVTGYTVNPRDHELFVDKIIYLLDHPEKRKLMGKAARKKVECEFTTQVISEKNIKFYKNLLQD